MRVLGKRVISDTVRTEWYGKVRTVTRTVYKAAPKPFKLLQAWDLPGTYERESWETEDDIWIQINKEPQNLRNFITIGLPKLPGPFGGYQLASDGYRLIAVIEERVYNITTEQEVCREQ